MNADGHGFLEKSHTSLVWGPVVLPGIVGKAGRDNVLPSELSAPRFGNYMVEGEVFRVKSLATITASHVIS